MAKGAPAASTKIEAALSRWATGSPDGLYQPSIILELVLSDLHRRRNESGPQAPLSMTKYWAAGLFATEALDATQRSIVLGRHSILAFLSIALRNFIAATAGEKSLLQHARACLELWLPLALRRESIEAVIETIAAVYEAAETVSWQEESMIVVLSLVLDHLTASVSNSGVSAKGDLTRQANQTFLKTALLHLSTALARSDLPATLRASLLRSASAALFGVGAMQRTDSIKSVLSSASVELLPALLDLYVASLRRHAGSLFPFSAKASGPDGPSKAATETHQLQKIRSAAWLFFQGVVELKPRPIIVLRCLEVMAKQSMYQTGQVEYRQKLALAVTMAADVLDEAEHVEDTDAAFAIAEQAVAIDERALTTELPRILARSIVDATPACRSFVNALRSHAAKTRQLPSFIATLLSLDLPTEPSVFHGPPLFGIEATHALARDVRGSLGSSQVVPLLKSCHQALLAQATADVEPPKKRRRTSASSAFRGMSYRVSATAQILTTILESCEIPKTIAQDVTDAVRDMSEGFLDGEDDGGAAARLQLRFAVDRRLPELDQHALGLPPLGLSAALRDATPDVKLAAARLLLQRSTTDEPIDGLNYLLETVKQPSSPWLGALYGLAPGEMPAATWSLLCHYMPRLDQVATDAQLDAIAAVIFSDNSAFEPITARLLGNASTTELSRLRDAVDRHLPASPSEKPDDLVHIVQRLSQLPASYLPLNARRTIVRAICSLPPRLEFAAFLRSAAFDDDACAHMIGGDVDYLLALARNASADQTTLNVFQLGLTSLIRVHKSAADLPGILDRLLNAMPSGSPRLMGPFDLLIVQTVVNEFPSSDAARKQLQTTVRAVVKACVAQSGVNDFISPTSLEAVWRLADWARVDDLSVLSAHASSATRSVLRALGTPSTIPPSELTALLSLSAFIASRQDSADVIETLVAVAAVALEAVSDSSGTSVVLVKSLRTVTAMQYAAALGLVEDRLIVKLSPAAIDLARVVLGAAPESARSRAHSSASRILRILSKRIAEGSEPLLVATARFIVDITDEHARLIDRADVGHVLELLSNVAQTASASTLQNVAQVVGQLARSRSDVLSSTFPMLVTLVNALLHRIAIIDSASTAALDATRAISRVLVDLVANSSLVGGWSKYAPFVLLRYLRRLPPIELRNALSPGIRALVGACGTHERDALLGGFLRTDEDAERTMLRAIVQSFEAVRYRGEA